MNAPQSRPNAPRLREMAHTGTDPVVCEALLDLARDCERRDKNAILHKYTFLCI